MNKIIKFISWSIVDITFLFTNTIRRLIPIIIIQIHYIINKLPFDFAYYTISICFVIYVYIYFLIDAVNIKTNNLRCQIYKLLNFK